MLPQTMSACARLEATSARASAEALTLLRIQQYMCG
jgi:hypothetical protein